MCTEKPMESFRRAAEDSIEEHRIWNVTASFTSY